MAFKLRWVVAALTFISFSGCGGVYDPQGFYDVVSGENQLANGQNALSLADSRSFERAEELAYEVLRRQPQDPAAILALGMSAEATGRKNLARRYYKAISSREPNDMVFLIQGNEIVRRWVTDVANERLAALEGKRPPLAVAKPVPPRAQMGALSRFLSLKKLADDGLITLDEYNARRDANIGALLPYSTTIRPAAGLTLLAPTPEQISGRLQALAMHYKDGSLVQREYERERNVILEGILPLSPSSQAKIPEKPTSQSEIAFLRGVLQKAQEAGILSDEEVSKEEQAMKAFIPAAKTTPVATTPSASATKPVRIAPAPVVKPAPKPATPVAAAAKSAPKPTPAPAAPAAPAIKALKPEAKPAPVVRPGDGKTKFPSDQWGILLDSVGSLDEANKVWAAMKKKYPAQLGKLSSFIENGAYGTFVIKAGPLKDQATASAVCRALALKQESCGVIAPR